MLMMSPRWGFRSKFKIQDSIFKILFLLLTSHFSLLTSHFSFLTSHLSLLTSIFIPANSTNSATRNPGIKDALA
ncbi:MAG: hypothetical protein M0P50_05055, partial [Bacteroidales bacterium]|nr:hypothetical protein [Bacteroidales bacterium]